MIVTTNGSFVKFSGIIEKKGGGSCMWILLTPSLFEKIYRTVDKVVKVVIDGCFMLFRRALLEPAEAGQCQISCLMTGLFSRCSHDSHGHGSFLERFLAPKFKQMHSFWNKMRAGAECFTIVDSEGQNYLGCDARVCRKIFLAEPSILHRRIWTEKSTQGKPCVRKTDRWGKSFAKFSQPRLICAHAWNEEKKIVLIISFIVVLLKWIQWSTLLLSSPLS